MNLRDFLSENVLLADGAMGTQIQAASLPPGAWEGAAGCNEILNRTAPEAIRAIHLAYLLDGGADAVETNTFGAAAPTLSEYGLADEARALARAGAESVLGVDSSAAALAEAEAAAERNGMSSKIAHEEADVPSRLRLARDRGEKYDLVVLDPPRLVTGKGNLEKGLRLYKDVNLLAMKLLSPDGILATFSCSGLVDRATFVRMLSFAAHDAGRKACILESLGQPADHPVPLDFPEAEYLKGAICRVG